MFRLSLDFFHLPFALDADWTISIDLEVYRAVKLLHFIKYIFLLPWSSVIVDPKSKLNNSEGRRSKFK